jgi:hypothetical protein
LDAVLAVALLAVYIVVGLVALWLLFVIQDAVFGGDDGPPSYCTDDPGLCTEPWR